MTNLEVDINHKPGLSTSNIVDFFSKLTCLVTVNLCLATCRESEELANVLLISLPERCPNLRHLHLRYNAYDDSDSGVLNLFIRLSTIKKLAASSLVSLGLRTFGLLCQVNLYEDEKLPTNDTLRSLCIHSRGGYRGEALIPFFRVFRSLTHVECNDCQDEVLQTLWKEQVTEWVNYA